MIAPEPLTAECSDSGAATFELPPLAFAALTFTARSMIQARSPTRAPQREPPGPVGPGARGPGLSLCRRGVLYPQYTSYLASLVDSSVGVELRQRGEATPPGVGRRHCRPSVRRTFGIAAEASRNEGGELGARPESGRA
jgi:hypothetical protein